MCPYRFIWKCDGDCIGCEYHAAGDITSLDQPLPDGNGTLGDYIPDRSKPMEEVIADRMLLGQLFARAPLGRLERDMPVGLLDLLFGCPPGRSVLAIAHGLGLDVVQGALTGEVCGGGHDQEHPARQRKK